MHKSSKSALVVAFFTANALATTPNEVLAGPMSVAQESSVGPMAPIFNVHYRRHYRHHYRRYGYDPAGAIFTGAALGLMGAGIAAATRPRYYYGYGYPYYGYSYPGYYGWGW